MPTQSVRNIVDASGITKCLFALRLLSWLAVGVIVYFCKPALAPVLFATLLAILLSPLTDWLERRHFPRIIAAILIVGTLIGSFAIVVDMAWNPTLKWIEDAPSILQKVEQKIRPLQRVLARIDSVTVRATSLTSTHTTPDLVIADASSREEGIVRMGAIRLAFINIVTVILLTIFLLIAGAKTLLSVESALIRKGYQCHYLHNIASVRAELSRYFATLASINVGLGCVTSLVLTLWGLPNPWLWGIMAAVLNFIPYIGPLVSLLVITVVSLVSFEGYVTAIGVAASFLGITTIEGQLVQPLLVGYRLNLNPIMLFLGIWLSGWFWGIVGVVLITPILIALKEVSNHQKKDSVVKAALMDRMLEA